MVIGDANGAFSVSSLFGEEGTISPSPPGPASVAVVPPTSETGLRCDPPGQLQTHPTKHTLQELPAIDGASPVHVKLVEQKLGVACLERDPHVAECARE